MPPLDALLTDKHSLESQDFTFTGLIDEMGLINLISLRHRVVWVSRRHLLKVTRQQERDGGCAANLPAGPHTCLSSQAWEVPPEVGRQAEGQPLQVCICGGGGRRDGSPAAQAQPGAHTSQ